MSRGEAVAASRRRGRVRRARILVAAGAAALVVGLVVFVQARTDTGPPPTAAPAAAPEPASTGEPLRKGGSLDPDARRVVERFAVATLGRTDLAAAWSMATPELRSGVSRAQWLRGELPVAPFPVGDLATSGFEVVESSSKKILLTMLLVPEEGSGFTPIRYDMTLVRASRSAPWKVSYFLPYAPPGMYSDKG